MSTTSAKQVISEFISSPQSDTLIIKGHWGTGKTYTWMHLVHDMARKEKISRPKYAYISLFGINSVDQMKNAVFEQTVPVSDIPGGANFATLRSNLESIFLELPIEKDRLSIWKLIWQSLKPTGRNLQTKARRVLPYAERVPFVRDYLPFVRSASFLSVKDMLICFDDFERKGEQLGAKEILGLISILKEQRNCKIAIILNDESLDSENLKDYRKYREKVVDIEIEFSPSSEECADLIFSADSPRGAVAKENAVRLNIRNIRILQRIKRLADGIWPELIQYEREIGDQVIHTLVLMAWAFYSKEKDVPPLDYIVHIGHKHFGLGFEKNKVPEEEKHWNALIRDYGYNTTDELGLEVAAYIRRGFFFSEPLAEKLRKLNEQVLAEKGGESFAEAWRLYKNSFKNNEQELISALSSRLRANTKYVTPLNLNSTIRLLRELGHAQAADDLIEVYIEKNLDRPGIFLLDSYPFRGDINDPQMIKRFAETAARTKESRSIVDVLKKITYKNGWSFEDEEILANATADEYYNFFKSEDSEHLAAYVDRCLQFGRYKDASESNKKIALNATEALKRIASESKLNKTRVRRFGVHLEASGQEKERMPN